MIFIFYILAVLLIYFSYRSFRGGVDYLNYFKCELAKPRSNYAPFATVFCPCKGIEEELEANLASLFEQEYPGFEIVFVVDDKFDTALKVIEEVSRTVPKIVKKTGVVVAPKATESSQKVENLREVVLHASPKSEVFVFVDSDARPSRKWLRDLVAPLEDPKVGAATGYRWFISKKPKFSTELRNTWNASIASVLGPNTKDNFCWGGSTAIRRDTFDKLDIREKWRGTLSDDFTVTRTFNTADFRICFVPQALTASFDDCSFGEMVEFTTRQMKITRVYMPKLWIMSFFGSGLFCVVMLWSLWIMILNAQNELYVWFAIFTFCSVSILSIGKSYLRLKAACLVLKEYEGELQKQLLPQLTLWIVTPFIFLINCVFALFSRRIRWRGITYEMVSPTQTRLDRE